MTKLIFVLSLLTLFMNSKSYSKSINCKTSNGLKVFKINKKSISFISTDDISRSIASEKKVNSRFTRMGFTKSINLEGNQHIFHIANKENFSNVEDYYIIRNSKGHEVIYPLDCTTNE